MAQGSRKIDISRVVNNTVGVISRNPVVFLGLSLLIVGLPNAAMEYIQGSPAAIAGSFSSSAAILTGLIGFFVFLFLSIVLQATLIVATLNDLANKEINLGDCINQAIRKFLPLLGLGLFFGLGISFGFMLFIVPGVILFLMWIVAAPVMIAENRGIIASLKRSAALTSGSKGMIFLLVIIFFIVAMIISAISASLGFFNATTSIIFALIANMITGALQGAGTASIYVDLRTAKEGTDSSTLAEVFA
ncbi:hypothetical protein AB1K62_08640 [Parasphingorhabdus sp. JC815]|uniref:hypothetical protein n=1 Tax=Parasphingorhabdus sp. JC815 TaxID=3232140 RepID=UPI003457561C